MAKRYRRTGFFFTSGISMGSALAMILSYVQHNSILWAVIAGLFSWFYVFYFILVYRILG